MARLACISHTILHIALPGVPDVYQGAEFWDTSLVDPAVKLVEDIAVDKTGVTKQWTLRRMLALRSRLRVVFERGSYTPATLGGAGSERVVAFHRREGEAEILVAVARFFTTPDDNKSWSEAVIKVAPHSKWQDAFNGSGFAASDCGSLHLRELFAAGPWAVLERSAK
jgi:(1->4)-alpha-D-glucan 1-alpha-D-glucosylmutase